MYNSQIIVAYLLACATMGIVLFAYLRGVDWSRERKERFSLFVVSCVAMGAILLSWLTPGVG